MGVVTISETGQFRGMMLMVVERMNCGFYIRNQKYVGRSRSGTGTFSWMVGSIVGSRSKNRHVGWGQRG